MTVYPRVCGGTRQKFTERARRVGLSPRVRGNRGHLAVLHGQQRSIPACAGEPASFALSQPLHPVYPRVCGGTLNIPTADESEMGLSPRVRGNLFVEEAVCILEGSIPACAGEPRHTRSMHGIHGVYPRVCGGTVGDSIIRQADKGLSPRVRGNRPQEQARRPS